MRSDPDPFKNRLLAGLSRQDLERFFANITLVPLLRKQTIYEIGDPIDNIYFIEQGLMSMLMNMADGTTSEVWMIGREGIIGTAALLGSEAAAQQMMVQIPGSAWRLGLPRCREAFEQSAAFRRAVLRLTEATLNFAAQTAACNRLHSVERRLARWLLMASDRVAADTMPLTHEFLSSMLGVRRAGVTAAAGELQRSGSIRYRYGRVTIVDRQALETAACECYRADQERFERLL